MSQKRDIYADYEAFKARQSTQTEKSRSRAQVEMDEKREREAERRRIACAWGVSVQQLLDAIDAVKRWYDFSSDDFGATYYITKAYTEMYDVFGKALNKPRDTIDQFEMFNDTRKMAKIASDKRNLSADQLDAISDATAELNDLAGAAKCAYDAAIQP